MPSSPVGIAGIDHALVGVRDLEAARAAWARLGFTVSPRGRHIGWGTANYCVMLNSGYVELLGILDAGQFTNNLDSFLAEREGLMGLAFASPDATETRRRLAALGIAAEGPRDLKRSLELSDGEALPALRLVFPAPAATPELKAFVCQHLSPELIRRLDWTIHRNGAKRLAGVTLVSDRPAAAAGGYAPLFGAAAVTVEGGEGRVDTGMGMLHFVSPAGFSARYGATGPLPDHPRPWVAAMTLAVADLVETADCLDARAVPWARSPAGIAVSPAHATGALLEFVAQAAG